MLEKWDIASKRWDMTKNKVKKRMVDTYVKRRSEFIVWLVDCSPNKKLRFK